ncbi:MAG: M23 family metallopeptidase [Ruminiclostridium sp.]|nr:M23 family metallopeptidase [Ruminiclostridium sp.]
MKKQDFAKVRDFMKGKGFIVALALSVAAVGGSAYYAYNSIMSGFEEGMGSEDLFVDVDKNQGGIPKDTQPSHTAPKDTPVSETTAVTTEPAATAANNFFPSKSPRTLPLEGEIINPYSDGELVKSQTLNLWQTHDGIDIAAEEGTDIKAAGEGTVLNIWEDGLWGVCLSIDHGNGYVSSYCGVDKSVPVTIGQKVACGDIIAKVGNTAECECALASHLHFEVKKDGEFTDPLGFTENR